MSLRKKQSGAVLLVALIFLVMMTMFAVSSINMSTVNLRIIGNMQAVKDMDAAAQDAIEQTISSMDQFNLTPTTSSTTYALYGTNQTITVQAPECIDTRVASGYSAVVSNIIPEDNTWEIEASTGVDAVTGAESTIHQGVEIRMLAGNCP